EVAAQRRELGIAERSGRAWKRGPRWRWCIEPARGGFDVRSDGLAIEWTGIRRQRAARALRASVEQARPRHRADRLRGRAGEVAVYESIVERDHRAGVYSLWLDEMQGVETEKGFLSVMPSRG